MINIMIGVPGPQSLWERSTLSKTRLQMRLPLINVDMYKSVIQPNVIFKIYVSNTLLLTRFNLTLWTNLDHYVASNWRVLSFPHP